jgi:uncharacterized membrane protein YgaE (UPF0421/DUF939 family)
MHLFSGRDVAAEVRLAIKMALAAWLGWWLATLAGQPRPIFAALVGLVALSGDPYSSLTLSIARVAGVFAGVAIGIGLLQLDIRLLWLVALGLLAGLLVGILLRVGQRANVQAAVSALFLIGLGRTGALHAGVARLWETAIGAGATLLVAVVLWPPHPVRELRARLERLRLALGEDLAVVAEDLDAGSGAVGERMEDLRARSVDAVRDVFALEQARRSLRLNLLRRHHAPALAELEVRINLAARLYRHARSVARDVLDSDIRSPELAAATRSLAEAADLALRGEDGTEARRRAAAALSTAPAQGDALVVRAQLGQMLADLEREDQPFRWRSTGRS